MWAFSCDLIKAVESHCHLLRPHFLGRNKELAKHHAPQSNLEKFTLDLLINFQKSPTGWQGGGLELMSGAPPRRTSLRQLFCLLAASLAVEMSLMEDKFQVVQWFPTIHNISRNPGDVVMFSLH